jgi:hypothetical protein
MIRYGLSIRVLPPIGDMITTNWFRSLRSLNETLWSLNETFASYGRYDYYSLEEIIEKSEQDF